MQLELSTSVLLSVGGIIASIASAAAVVKTKVDKMEKSFDSLTADFERLRDEVARYKSDEDIRVALLENNQQAHEKELESIKTDLKTIMSTVQEIKETVIKIKKGDR